MRLWYITRSIRVKSPIQQLPYNILMSNETRVDAILDTMEKQNPPQQMGEGLQILYKLIHNIINNPMQPKYRNLKTTNNTIKSKVMNLKGIENLLRQLGYSLQDNNQIYVLKDEQIGEFFEGAPGIDYRRRLTLARLESEDAYERELVLVKEHRRQQRQRFLREQEAERLKQQCRNDAAERKHMTADTSKSNTLTFGTKTTTWKDIGVDLCNKKKG